MECVRREEAGEQENDMWQKNVAARTNSENARERESERERERTVEDYYTRLQEVCADVNRRHDVADLCKGFRARLEKVVEKEGDAIGK